MKFHLSLIFTLLLSLIPTQAIAADEIVEKTECVQAFGYADLDALKVDLLLRAKRLAVDDLFGFLIVSSSAVQQSVLTDDEISTSSVGYVRVKGIPDYNHGDSLAEVCVTIQAYVTENDRMKFDPIPIAADECVTQPDLNPRKLEDLGEEQTIIKALINLNKELEDKDRASLLKLVRNVKFSDDSKIISNTDTYCGSVTAEVVPIEIEAFLSGVTSTSSSPDESLNKESKTSTLSSSLAIIDKGVIQTG